MYVCMHVCDCLSICLISFGASAGTAMIFVSFSAAALVAKRRHFLYLGGMLGSAMSVLCSLRFAATLSTARLSFFPLLDADASSLKFVADSGKFLCAGCSISSWVERFRRACLPWNCTVDSSWCDSCYRVCVCKCKKHARVRSNKKYTRECFCVYMQQTRGTANPQTHTHIHTVHVLHHLRHANDHRRCAQRAEGLCGARP